MYCKYCGTDLKEGEATCPYCGNPVTFSPADAYRQSAGGANGNAQPPANAATENQTAQPSQQAQPQPQPYQTYQSYQPYQYQPQMQQQTAQPIYPQAGFCSRCGQKLKEGEATCSFCGQSTAGNATQGFAYRPPYTPGQPAYYPPYYAQQPQPVEKKGTVLGIIALLLSFFGIGTYCITAIAGLVCGIIATVQGSKTSNTAALILGIFAIILAAMCCFIYLIVIAFLLDSGTGTVY